MAPTWCRRWAHAATGWWCSTTSTSSTDPKLKRETAARLPAQVIEEDLGKPGRFSRVRSAPQAMPRPSYTSPREPKSALDCRAGAVCEGECRGHDEPARSGAQGAGPAVRLCQLQQRVRRALGIPRSRKRIRSAGPSLRMPRRRSLARCCARPGRILYGLEAVALRFFTVYGPRQRPDLAISKFAKLIRRGDPVPFFGDGTAARDYTFVEDTVTGVIAAVDRAWPQFEVINLGGSRPVALAELVRSIEKAAGKKAVLAKQPPQPPVTCRSRAPRPRKGSGCSASRQQCSSTRDSGATLPGSRALRLQAGGERRRKSNTGWAQSAAPTGADRRRWHRRFFTRLLLSNGVFTARDILRVYYPLKQYLGSPDGNG